MVAPHMNKVKRGAGPLHPGSGSTLRLPLPLALACCFVFFYAGLLFGGKQFSKLPDMRQPRMSAEAKAKAAAAEKAKLLETNRTEGVGQGQARRQLAAHMGEGGDTQGQVVYQERERESPDGERVVEVLLPKAFPHGNTGHDELDIVAMQMISWQPRAYIFPGFAPPEKCDNIVALARRYLQRSGLALRAGETEAATRDIRTSSGAFLAATQDPSGSLKWVEDKMARISMIPPQHGEAYNVLRYELGQHYDSHMDVFDPKEYGPQSSNRVASFLLYLTDVEEGGETMFPYEGGKNMGRGYNFKDCVGLKVKPRKGDALLFWSMYPNGQIDPHSLHGSCPVIKGEKWVATKWIRDKPMHM